MAILKYNNLKKRWPCGRNERHHIMGGTNFGPSDSDPKWRREMGDRLKLSIAIRRVFFWPHCCPGQRWLKLWAVLDNTALCRALSAERWVKKNGKYLFKFKTVCQISKQKISWHWNFEVMFFIPKITTFASQWTYSEC